MKPKTLAIAFVLVALFLCGQWLSWKQQTFDYVNNYMFTYTTPRMRRFLAMGHDALVSNLSLIRGIQFYGMNYPLFNKKPVMYDQFAGLAQAAVQLDPRFTEAYRFWGFAMTSADRGKVDSYRFLIGGAEKLAATDTVVPPVPRKAAFLAVQPSLWEVAKDAGYIAQYELHDETPEWGIRSYEMALLSPDCPEFVARLKTLAEAKLTPDPMIPILEFQTYANRTTNEAIRQLNLTHIRDQISKEHKRFWEFAQQAHVEIHGASATRIAQLTGDIPVVKAAVEKYYETSREWNPGGPPQLFPNLKNWNPGPTEPIEVEVARPPQLPVEPNGGQYLILDIQGEPTLVATGTVLQEREVSLEIAREAIERYKKEHNDECPPSLSELNEKTEARLLEADMYGYPMLLDREECRYYFPEISESVAPTLPPYGKEPELEETPSLGLMPKQEEVLDLTEEGSPSSASAEVQAASP